MITVNLIYFCCMDCGKEDQDGGTYELVRSLGSAVDVKCPACGADASQPEEVIEG